MDDLIKEMLELCHEEHVAERLVVRAVADEPEYEVVGSETAVLKLAGFLLEAVLAQRIGKSESDNHRISHLFNGYHSDVDIGYLTFSEDS